MQIVNISAYKFADVPNPNDWRAALKERGVGLELLGSILLAPEGINVFLAGERASIDAYMEFLRSDELFAGRFSDLVGKESITDYQPFKRMVVRIKKEIITMKHPMIRPADTRASAVDAKTLKKWLDQGHDDHGREVLLLDTRNQYEVDIGTFNGARSLQIDFFSEFPQALQSTAHSTRSEFENKTIVSFCTGGIRCEKAVLLMRENNFENVYQLDGGILRYFEEVGGEHWNGECFVFDRRVALDSNLQATTNKYEVTAAPLRNSQYLEKIGAQHSKL
jgi:UPF0176 protein